MYITITIAFHDYELFSQTLSFVLLIFITVFSLFLAIVGMIAYILTQLFYWVWLMFAFNEEKQIGAICFIFLFFKDKKIDKRLIYLLIAIVLKFVSLAVPIQLSGCAITMFWAVETVTLLWLWQKSEIRIFKYGFIVIELLVMISLLMD